MMDTIYHKKDGLSVNISVSVEKTGQGRRFLLK
jgi:hypothetical protein